MESSRGEKAVESVFPVSASSEALPASTRAGLRVRCVATMEEVGEG